jgi:hypothetical protein
VLVTLLKAKKFLVSMEHMYQLVCAFHSKACFRMRRHNLFARSVRLVISPSADDDETPA